MAQTMIRNDVANDDDGPWTEIPTHRERFCPSERTRFGIEIEFNHPEQAAAQPRIVATLKAKGIPAVHAWNTPGHWSMKHDPTVTGGELVSPILSGSDKSIEEALQAVETVVEDGGFTGTRAGMHMHFGIKRFDHCQMRCLVDNLQTVDSILNRFAGEGRVGDGAYNTPATAATFERLRAWADEWNPNNPRYMRTDPVLYNYCPVRKGNFYNFEALYSHGTLEVRQFGNTLRVHRIRAWIRVIQAVLTASRRLVNMREMQVDDPLRFLAGHGLDDLSIEVFENVLAKTPEVKLKGQW